MASNPDDILSDSELTDNEVNPSMNTLGSKINPARINAEDPPEFVKQYANPQKPDSPLSLEVSVLPQNPFTIDSNATSLGNSTFGEGLKYDPSFIETAKTEYKNFNVTAQAISAGINKYEQVSPQDDITPAGWTPKSDMTKFVNIRPEKMVYLMGATGPKDLDYRIHRALEEQHDDDVLANGSILAKIVGGALGVVTDPVSYIPIVGAAKYAKFAPTILSGIARSLPGTATYAVLSSAAEQANKTTGNLTDFLTQAATNTVFGSVLFGGLGAAGLSADKLALWETRNLAKETMDGVDFKLKTDGAGKVTGYQAVDTDGSLSAAKLSFAQDLADSSFKKSGIFKIPYVGAGTEAFLKGKLPYIDAYFGSQFLSMIDNPLKSVRGIVDRIVDHNIITEGVANGKASPTKFSSLMNQSFAQVRSLAAQMNALHMERNGIEISTRPLRDLTSLGMNLKDKATKAFAKNIDNTGYVTRDAFDEEVEQVLRSKTPSPEASVNTAASMMREQLDTTYANYRKAYGLPEDWMPPKTAEGYLMRVYNTPYMNVNKGPWVEAISKWLDEADVTITQKMEPINNLSQTIKEFEEKNTEAVRMLAAYEERRGITGAVQPEKRIEEGVTLDREGDVPNASVPVRTTTAVVSPQVNQLRQMRQKLTAMREALQDELRSNPDLHIHVDDWNALSATEAKKIKEIMAPLKEIEKQLSSQKEIIKKAKARKSRILRETKLSETIEKAQPRSKKFIEAENNLKIEEAKLRELEDAHFAEKDRIQQEIHDGKVDKRLFKQKPDSFEYEFKDPENRLKFRDVHGSEGNPDSSRARAEAAYNSILNQRPEDTINQVMGKFSGNKSENHIKSRSLLVPDEIVQPFMSKDLMAKVSNYTTYLNRRTHLKNVFNDVTIDGGFEPVLNEVTKEYNEKHGLLNTMKDELKQKLSAENVTSEQTKKITKQINKVDKQIVEARKNFDYSQKALNRYYEKMMGIKNYTQGEEKWRSAIMSMTSIASLPFVPFTMINDLSAVGLQHGMIPFIRDGVYPILESLGGLLKTKDSAALRNSAPSVHLALQDVLNGYADKNWGMHNDPYLNLGKIVGSLEWLSHANANVTGTNFIDNGLQHITGAVTQAELMRIMHAFKAGKMSEKDGITIRKYGIDPEKWADRMIAAFKQDGGGRTKMGGYQSNFWKWNDVEASNKFGDAVFRGIKDTQIQTGLADSPMWTDSIMGSIIKGFSGWMYASINRYVIPSMQRPDADKLLGLMFMLTTGALVDPMRRIARGDDPVPPNQTPKQFAWSAISNSGYFSYFTQVLADANLLSGDRLMGDLKNDKYKDRSRVGLLGPAWGKMNQMADILGMVATGEYNKNDVNKFARMVPFMNASWTYWMSKQLIDRQNLPQSRAQAHALKQYE